MKNLRLTESQYAERTKKASKYRNVKTDGFDSKREAARYQELLLLEKAGEIEDLKTQVKIELIPKQDGERACSFYCDFVYNTRNGVETWEDSKGRRTKDYIIKRKLLLWLHKIRILET